MLNTEQEVIDMMTLAWCNARRKQGGIASISLEKLKSFEGPKNWHKLCEPVKAALDALSKDFHITAKTVE